MLNSPTAEIFRDVIREKRIETALFLASDFRTGSTLLGRLLQMQTELTFQRESFNTVPTWHVLHDAPLRQAISAALGPVRSGGMAAKLMWPHRNNLARVLGHGATDAAAGFCEIFPCVRFVHMARRDKVAQAVSFHIARHSNVWSSSQVDRDREAPVPYIFAEIIHYYMHFLMFETAWAEFLTVADPGAPMIYYEDLVEDVAGHVELCMTHFGLPFDRALIPADLPLTRQAGDLARRFSDRFRHDLCRYSPVAFLPGRLIGPPTP